jgi:hypothetical protein
MRLCDVAQEEIEELVCPQNRVGEDPDGNLLYVGAVRSLSVCVVLALDDLDTVITVYDLEA